MCRLIKVMPKKKQPSKKTTTRQNTSAQPQELDGVFFLKLVLYMILGSMWLKVTHNDALSLPIPLGVIIGLFFTSHEHFQIDRKIEYAVLLVAMLVGYLAPYGLYINL